MDRHRILRAVLVPLATLLVLVACEGDGSDATPEPSQPSRPTETSTIAAPPGSYRYDGLGVAAVLTFDGSTGALEVRNDTGVELGDPHLYVFRADDGARIDLATRDPEPVPEGRTVDLKVSFDGEPPPIGMVFLMFGEDDFGAFVQVAGGTG